MKRLTYKLFVSVFAIGSLVSGLGCNDSDNPDPVNVANLKYASDLSIVDDGAGGITLQWRASNFEDNFEGYNIYAVKMSDSKIAELADNGLVKGQPLQLLDDEGDARAEAKTILQAFNYNTDNPINAVKEEEPGNEEERKFSFLPIHNTTADGTPVLPTCYPGAADGDGVATCTDTTESDDLDSDTITANGTVQYTISSDITLTYGEQYCFLVFSVQDEGGEISQTSANFECVRPKIENADTLESNGTGQRGFMFDDYITDCTADGACTDVDNTADTLYDDGEDGVGGNEQIHIEVFSGTPFISTGDSTKCGILDYGYRANGFTGLNEEAPAFGYEFETNGIFNNNGYSIPGQSVRLRARGMYVHACQDADDATKATYHWLYINQDTDVTTTAAGTFEVIFRISASSR